MAYTVHARDKKTGDERGVARAVTQRELHGWAWMMSRRHGFIYIVRDSAGAAIEAYKNGEKVLKEDEIV
jgi:hypothetical protein